mgnify:CR=1 FL=1
MTAEWAAAGLQINALAPGYIHTEMTQHLVDDQAFNDWVLNRTPAGRWGSSADLVGPAVWLASGWFGLCQWSSDLRRRRHDRGAVAERGVEFSLSYSTNRLTTPGSLHKTLIKPIRLNKSPTEEARHE